MGSYLRRHSGNIILDISCVACNTASPVQGYAVLHQPPPVTAQYGLDLRLSAAYGSALYKTAEHRICGSSFYTPLFFTVQRTNGEEGRPSKAVGASAVNAVDGIYEAALK